MADWSDRRCDFNGVPSHAACGGRNAFEKLMTEDVTVARTFDDLPQQKRLPSATL
jgi:hypothetical protein